LGLPKIPSVERHTACPLLPVPGPERPFPGFGNNLPKLSLVPFLPFLPTSTVYSRLCFTGLLHPAADHGVHHVSGHLLTSAGQGTAQSGPSPLAAAFAVSLTRRPFSTADSDWSFPKEPVERCESSPSKPRLLRPKTARPHPWRPYPIPKDRIQRCFRWLPESGLRLRPRLVAPNPEVLCSPMRQVWIVNHSQWCIHPSKFSPHHQQTSGQCVVRKPHDHPVVLPSRRCSQASLPLPPPLPKKKCQQWSFFPVLDLKALFQRRVRCIGCELPHSQCPLLPWASALSFDVQFPDSFQHQGVGPKSLPTPPPARLSSHLLPEGHRSSLRRCGLTFHRSERNPSKLAFTTTRVASPTTDTFSSELESLPEADVRDRRRSVARPTNSSTRKWSI